MNHFTKNKFLLSILNICFCICVMSNASLCQCTIDNTESFLCQPWVQEALNEVDATFGCESESYSIITYEQDGIDYIAFSCVDETSLERSYMLYTCNGDYSDIICYCAFTFSCNNGFFDGFCVPEFEGELIYEGSQSLPECSSDCSTWINEKIESEIGDYCTAPSICFAIPSDYYYKVFETTDGLIIFEKFDCQTGLIEIYYKNGDLSFTCNLSYVNDEISPDCNLNNWPFELNNTLLYGCNLNNNTPIPNIELEAVGMPCDDGNVNTQNDVIQEDCSCKGEGINSVEDLPKHSAKIYPNPVTNFLHLDVKESVKIQKISIINIYGLTVYMNKENKNTMDLTNLVSGIYFIKIETDRNGPIVFEIIKI